MSTTSRIPDDDWPERRSKRTPESSHNSADDMERLLETDGFKKWGFVIYRCTYQSNSDWDAFMTRLHYPVKEFLKYNNGLDLLDDFAPTVIEDPSFTGATTAMLREHFRKWAPKSGRYRYFIMVDQESLESVLTAPAPWDTPINKTGFVRLVNGVWKPYEMDEEDLAVLTQPPEEFEPLEGCTLEDVGWMNILYNDVQLSGFLDICCVLDWSTYYCRPPEIRELL